MLAPRIEKTVKAILNDLGYTDPEISIVVVGDSEIRELNRKYRGVDNTTDVLAFSMLEGESSNVYPPMLGDIVINISAARRTAQTCNVSFFLVMDLLLVHGILHLIGYDHENHEDARRMIEKTLELMERLDYGREELDWYVSEMKDFGNEIG